MRCNVKLFADVTSLFTVVQDSNSAAKDMNHDLELIRLIFSRKKIKADHPEIFFNSTPVMKVDEHKHLAISAHIKSAISKSRKGIGLLKYLSKYLPRHTLNELYNLYVRPHLDYGDVIYHIPAKVCKFSGSVVLPSPMEKLDSA